jgi:hypothetical protein
MTYFDIYTELKPQKPCSSWQLDALTCLVLACKFEERDDHVPLTEEILKVCMKPSTNPILSSRLITKLNQVVTYEQVCCHEIEVLKALEWDLN